MKIGLTGDILNEKLTFDEKFLALDDYYNIDSPSDVENFLKNNDGIFVILEDIKPYLEEYFSNCKYCLEMVYDPEFESCDHLVLRIYVSSHRFHNGARDDIRSIRERIVPIRRQVGIFGEFAVRPGVLNV